LGVRTKRNPRRALYHIAEGNGRDDWVWDGRRQTASNQNSINSVTSWHVLDDTECDEKADATAQRKEHLKTLDLTFIFVDNRWVWRSRPEVTAFIDRGEVINIISSRTSAIKGALQAAAAKWGTNLKISGTEEFRRQAWLEGKLLGLNIKGYEPTEADLQRLNGIQQEHAEKIKNYPRSRKF
jgi:hypothetical protein